MARSIRSNLLETRTGRLRLPIAKKPVFVKIGIGVHLGYRRNQTAGTWVARVVAGSKDWTRSLGSADDYQAANGADILDFWHAQAKANAMARSSFDGDKPVSIEPATVAQAVDAYEGDLRTRGGDVGNVSRLRANLPSPLAAKPVSNLTARDLKSWRDALARKLAPATVNRTANVFRAALNQAADADDRVVSRRAWETGLAAIPDAETARNVILGDNAVRSLIAEAYALSPQFGLLVHTAAETGARISQLSRMTVADLQGGTAPRLMVPSSHKGRGKKVMLRRPVPISIELAERLHASAASRAPDMPLLAKESGDRWRKSDHARPFKRIVARVGIGPEVTIYALRHSAIVRELLANVPIRLVAVNHDTSVAMIERNYSAHIADHGEALARAALLG